MCYSTGFMRNWFYITFCNIHITYFSLPLKYDVESSMLHLKIFCCWQISNHSYIITSIFILICIILSTVGGQLHVSVRRWSQRWELMWCSTKNSTQAVLVSGELSRSFRDRVLHSFWKGSAWLVCYYWPTDVKGSVTCLVKRKKFEGMGERGLLCN